MATAKQVIVTKTTKTRRKVLKTGNKTATQSSVTCPLCGAETTVKRK